MKYNCTIVDILDEDEVKVDIQGILINGFINCGVDKIIGEKVNVEMEFFDDLVISESKKEYAFIEKTDAHFGYLIGGKLDVDGAQVQSLITFDLPSEDLYDYGYLHGKYVEIEVKRIDFLIE